MVRPRLPLARIGFGLRVARRAFRIGGDELAELLRRQADSALYEVKRRGREMAVGSSEIAGDVAPVTRGRAQALPVRRIDELTDAAGPRVQAGQGYGLGRPAPEMPSGRRHALAL